ncbi:hypothetical protein EMCRGX_G034977 [Ephydatia muelleri]
MESEWLCPPTIKRRDRAYGSKEFISVRNSSGIFVPFFNASSIPRGARLMQ